MFTEYYQQMIDNIVDVIETDYIDQDSVNIRDILTIESYVNYTLLSEEDQVKFLDEVSYRSGVILLDQ